MDRQDIFNKVWAHFQQMPKPAMRFRGREPYCMYRTEDGNRCFIGSQIPDEKYNKGLENQDATSTAVQQAMGLGSISYSNTFFLLDLQKCHDKAVYDAVPAEVHSDLHGIIEFDLAVWRSNTTARLHAFAKENELEIPNATG